MQGNFLSEAEVECLSRVSCKKGVFFLRRLENERIECPNLYQFYGIGTKSHSQSPEVKILMGTGWLPPDSC